METTINPKDFIHVEERSVYNNNYYKHKDLDYLIKEECNEDYNYYDYFLIEDEVKVYLGQSQSFFGMSEGNEIKFTFKREFT